jgi:hypothetical protein
MSRIHSMDRFAPPTERDEDTPVTSCYECGQELYEGDSVLWFDGVKFCSEGCLFEYLGVETETLYKDDSL